MFFLKMMSWFLRRQPALFARLNDPASLLGHFVKGGGVLAAASMVDNVLRFARNIILARLLAPDAFGIYALMASAMAVAEAIGEMGLREVVVQSKRGRDHEFLNVIWWLSAVRGMVIYTCLFVTSYPLAHYYFHDQPGAVVVMQVGFLASLINGFASPQLHALQKDFAFGKWVLLIQSSGALGVLVAVTVGCFTHSIWALVAGLLTEATAKCLLSYGFLPFRPVWNVCRDHKAEVFRYTKGIFGLPILMVIMIHTDTFVIGKLMSTTVLGAYYLAKELADLPNKVLNRVISPLLLPAFSAQQDQLARIRKQVLQATELIMTLGLPYATFCGCLGDHCLRLLYGEMTSSMWAPFGIFSVVVLLQVLSLVVMNVFLALGTPQTQRLAAIARTIVLVVLIYPLCRFYGAKGATLAALASMVTALAVQLYSAQRIFGLNPWEQMKAWFMGLKLSCVVLVVSLGVRWLGMGTLGSLLVGGFVCAAACGVGVLQHPMLQGVRDRIWRRA